MDLSRDGEFGSLCAGQSRELENGKKAEVNIQLFFRSFFSLIKISKTHLSTPAHPQDSPFLDTGELGLGLGDGSLDLGDHFKRRRGVDKERAKGSLFLLGIRRDPRVVGIYALQVVRHQSYGIELLGQAIGTLECLRIESEDVVDDNDSILGRGVASNIWFCVISE